MKAEILLHFNIMLTKLMAYMIRKKIPFRLGEAHRPFFVAHKYFIDGIGIINSKHRKSLAVDIWLTTPDGRKIYGFGCPIPKEINKLYHSLGIYWEKMGGSWGGNFKKYYDPYHFEANDAVI